VVGAIGAYVAQVDRVLGAGQGLFAASGGGGGIAVGGPPDVPPSPGGAALGGGADGAGDRYQASWGDVNTLDSHVAGTAAAGRAEVGRGHRAASAIRQTAATQAAALAPAGGSPAGVRLLVSRMEERLGALQRQIEETQTQNRLLGLRLRQVAAAYGGAVGAAPAGAAGGGMAGLPASGAASPFGGRGFAGWGAPAGRRGRAGWPAGLDGLWGADRAGGPAAQRAVAYAATKVGAPYVWGAAGPHAYDCSGLVHDAYAHAGIALPRTTYGMVQVGAAVGRGQVRAGDLVFSNFSSRGPEHVQLAVSPAMVIEAPAPGGHVQFAGLPSGRIVVKRVD